ncbi:exosome complex protein Rrp42 [Candidatus Woesearchaeota archaeon]|nr:exosome complex protein Rrp42 [Candidatus Woesearchaeota archaeon]
MHNDVKQHAQKFLQKGLRLDGRTLLDYRSVVVEYGAANGAEGSARVKIGDTEVIVGIKMSVEKPYPDTPDAGCLMVGAELLPLSNPEFESGPPSIDSIELARVVDRGIRESKAVDMKALCITPGEKVWNISVDICPINDDGNLFDAASLGTLVALKDTKLPTYDGKSVDYHTKTSQALPLQKEPIEVTVHKIGKYFIVDPTTEEEGLVDARLTVATMEDGTLCALQKGGNHTVTLQDVETMIDIATAKAHELRKAL